MRIFVIIFFALSLVSCGPGMNKILKSKDPAYKLKMAEKFFAGKKYGKAATIFEDIKPFYTSTPQYEDILYKWTYAIYNQKDYLNAENLFKTFVESYPNSPRTEEMEYMRAYTNYKLAPKPELDPSNNIKAIGMFQTFVVTHPGSVRVAESNRIIDELRNRLETKEYKGAKLYYDMGQFRAAGVAFTSLMDNFPESPLADEYQYMVVKSYYRFAELSVAEKKVERYQDVLTECNEFFDRFPESKWRKEIDNYMNISNSEIQKFSNNEQIKTTT